MPGPLLTVTISESARRGYSAGPLLIVGHSILELALVTAICLGLGVYLKAAPVMAATALFGGSILLYLGIQMLRTAGRQSIQAEARAARRRAATPVITGALTSLANPYWTLWWATFGLGYLMRISGKGLPGIAVFFAGHIAADFAWYSHGLLRSKQGRRAYEGRNVPDADQGMRGLPCVVRRMVSSHRQRFFPRVGFLKNQRPRFYKTLETGHRQSGRGLRDFVRINRFNGVEK